jgi:two-component system chemotaxis response regulator CheY
LCAVSDAMTAGPCIASMPVRILIADDNATYRKALRQLLEAVDHWEVVEARDGLDAITKSVETRPQVIVIDLAMPSKDGLAAAREISSLLPAIPILMCTMHMSPFVETEAMKAGVRKVLSKSDSSFLVPAIRQLLPPELSATEAPVAHTIPPPPVDAALPPASSSLTATASERAAEPLPLPLPKNVP